ncbi:hypothetical protein Poli38472_014679 [Pythium oligandrum]|uniref:Uncharacterized protein n=1 Tax=Pythium oligandrum TaxID=41045 RepID=A0A8K1FKA3_PYTOL|nr:hypothetical protein Poli38472_014679 [Pythium oligandrum]|eukprot:TMW63974.1 hypothetical protein Poli38472_014679 [Pythium oligandrum]
MHDQYRQQPPPLKADYILGHSPSYAKTDDVSSSYLAPPQRPVQESTVRGRFVAGEEFFNYDAMGGLREGLHAVELMTASYFGLLVNSAIGGFATIFFQYVFQQLLVADFTAHHQAQINAAKYLLQWPGAFSVFIGLISDSIPIMGSRRKSYMILGWIIACIMFLSMVIVYHTTSSEVAIRGYLLLIFGIIAAFGLQVSYIAALAMTVELAQREHLYQRGHLQSFYLALYFGFSLIAQIVAAYVLKPSDDGVSMTATIDLAEAAAILAGICVVPLPFLLFCLVEDRADGHRVPLTRRMGELWRLLQWKVVYMILFFLCGAMFFSAAYDDNVQTAVMLWSNIMPSKAMWIYVVKMAAKFVGVVIWKAWLVNYSWRRLAFIMLLLNVVANMVLAVPTIYDAVRNEWYLHFWSLVADIPFGLFELFVLVAPTEIADIGREGAVIGLVYSFMVLIVIATFTLWESVSDAVGLNVNVMEIMVDSRETRNEIMTAGSVYIVVNLLGVATAFFMPNQKLDAQQQRAFGGYNRLARMVLTLVFVLLLTYDLVANILKITA